MQTIIALPQPLKAAISTCLAEAGAAAWLKRAQTLHLRYTQQVEDQQQTHLMDALDAAAYLGLRAAATYAQLWSALEAIQELLPDWQPQCALDLGCGAGSGLWALTSLFPSLTHATAIDQNGPLLALGQRVATTAELPLTVTWQRANILQSVEQVDEPIDLLVIASVLNELNPDQRAHLLTAAFARCRGVLLILEPGTPVGSRIVAAAAQQLAPQGFLLAPYLANHFVDEPWLHFPQRFTRPDFLRRLRQSMRESSLMASDWEEAKYSYVAVSKVRPAVMPWGRTVGPVQLHKGHLEVPVLTAEQCRPYKVFKRQKPQYALAKKLRWGEIISQANALF